MNVNEMSVEELFLIAERPETKREFKKALLCLVAAAKRGHVFSQTNLGNFYSSGIGTKRDPSRAAYWYRTAYRNGSALGAYCMGVDKLDEESIRGAVFWFKRAAQRRHGGAIVKLAEIYLSRRGGKKKALALLRGIQYLSDSEASESDREDAERLLLAYSRNVPLTRRRQIARSIPHA